MPKSNAIPQFLISFLNDIEPLSMDVIALINKESVYIKAKKGTHLPATQHDQEYILFFVISGVVRGFILDKDKDITVRLVGENSLIGHIRHPKTDVFAYDEHLQALEETELIAIPYTAIDQLYSRFPETNILGRKLLAMQYHSSHIRSILSRIPSAEERYRQFLMLNPTLQTRIAGKFLASYLGMRIETLSRVRAKFK
ncbi:Crp/Fnr family transcriptional regulator [Pedobacter sp. AW1-32]|uniref:Crp/Fnr family transcriptional regulator n=1 Tax=Pedobacter sp. AW1-32 TaxID=3383026 RepID=UPI003FF13B6C